MSAPPRRLSRLARRWIRGLWEVRITVAVVLLIVLAALAVMEYGVRRHPHLQVALEWVEETPGGEPGLVIHAANLLRSAAAVTMVGFRVDGAYYAAVEVWQAGPEAPRIPRGQARHDTVGLARLASVLRLGNFQLPGDGDLSLEGVVVVGEERVYWSEPLSVPVLRVREAVEDTTGGQ